MPYSQRLAERVRHALAAADMTEKKMFGGLGFLTRGNMCVCVWNDLLIARLGIARAEEALTRPHVRAFDVTGRPMKGWVMVEAEGLETDEQLELWLDLALAFTNDLPAK